RPERRKRRDHHGELSRFIRESPRSDRAQAASADRRRAVDQEAFEEVAGQSAGKNRGARRSDPHLERAGTGARRTRRQGQRLEKERESDEGKNAQEQECERGIASEERVLSTLQRAGHASVAEAAWLQESASGPEGREGRRQYFDRLTV